MSGRRARFPPAETAMARPLGALRFEIPVEGGEHVTITLSDASRPRLARAFGAALRDSLTAPGVVCTPAKVRRHVDELRRFLHFLDAAGEAVDTIAMIEPTLFDRYEAWLKAQHLRWRHLSPASALPSDPALAPVGGVGAGLPALRSSAAARLP